MPYFCIISLYFSLVLAHETINLVPPLLSSKLFLLSQSLYFYVQLVSYMPQSLHQVLLWFLCTILLSCDMHSFVVVSYYSSVIFHHFPLGII